MKQHRSKRPQASCLSAATSPVHAVPDHTHTLTYTYMHARMNIRGHAQKRASTHTHTHAQHSSHIHNTRNAHPAGAGPGAHCAGSRGLGIQAPSPGAHPAGSDVLGPQGVCCHLGTRATRAVCERAPNSCGQRELPTACAKISVPDQQQRSPDACVCQCSLTKVMHTHGRMYEAVRLQARPARPPSCAHMAACLRRMASCS